jgi:heptosyltransferase I
MILKWRNKSFLKDRGAHKMRILIVKLSSLGDIIHAFPVLQYLKQCHPQCEIDWVVEQPFAELVQAHPFVSRTICVQTKRWRSEPFKAATWEEMIQFRRDLRKTRYDLILDLQGNTKSALATTFARSSFKVGFGYPAVSEWPNLLVTHKKYHPPSGQNAREEYLFIAKNALGNFNEKIEGGVRLNLTEQEKGRLQPILERLQRYSGLKILVCSGSNWANKQLSKETLQSFLQCIKRQFNAHFFLIWGNAAEKLIAEDLVAALPQQSTLIDKLSLPSLQNLMAQMDVVVAMDSLPLHLAGTTSTPTYSVFGASSASKYKPIGEHHEAFQGSCPYGKAFERRCNILRTCKTGACIKDLEGEQLFENFKRWWSSLTRSLPISEKS